MLEEEIVVSDQRDDIPFSHLKNYGTFSQEKLLESDYPSQERESWKIKMPEISFDKEHNKKSVNKYYHKLTDFVDLIHRTEEKLNKIEVGDKMDLEEELELQSRKKCGVQFAIYASFILNVSLLLSKIIALISSKSNSILASLVDSALDLLAGSIIFITNYFINKKQIYLYPAGKSRIEPLGIIVFSSLMFMLSFFVVIEGSKTLSDLKNFHLESNWISISIILGTIGVKMFLYIYCKFCANSSSSVSALVEDHRNDVLTNIFGLAGFLLGSKLSTHFENYKYKMIDPIFAIFLACFIMRNWYLTGKENVVFLSGKAAPNDFLNLLTFIVWNHHPKIKHIDTVRAYHLAERYLVEIDIILDENMPLKEAHNIGESLQIKIEELDEVERCFVHLDYEYDHPPEHKSK